MSPPPRPPHLRQGLLPTLLPIGDLLDILPDAVLMVDAGGRIVYVNPAVQSLLGYAPDEIVGQPLSMLVPRQLRQRHETLMRRFHDQGAPTMMGSRPVLHAVHRNGTLQPVSISLCNLTLTDGSRVSVAVVHDVAELHTHLDRATAQAETDALSGLGNRLRLSRRMQALLSNERPFGLLYLDLERFKQINDAHGHAAGDRALQVVARRLQAQVRDVDLVVRLGGDEFVLLLDALDDPDQLAERAQAIAAAVTRPLRLGELRLVLGANLGGAISPRHGSTEAALLAAADEAMYRAKQAGQSYGLAQG